MLVVGHRNDQVEPRQLAFSFLHLFSCSCVACFSARTGSTLASFKPFAVRCDRQPACVHAALGDRMSVSPPRLSRKNLGRRNSARRNPTRYAHSTLKVHWIIYCTAGPLEPIVLLVRFQGCGNLVSGILSASPVSPGARKTRSRTGSRRRDVIDLPC